MIDAEQIKTALNELCSRAVSNCSDHGEELVSSSDEASASLLLWLQYFTNGQVTGTADCLLEGAKSAVRESAACLSLGLARPALNSLRLQIDLLLAWIYFKDHPVEWERVGETGDGFKIKKELFKYFAETYPKFQGRFGTLKECAARVIPDPYRFLSAHVHGQSEHVLPKVNAPADVVAGLDVQREVVVIQSSCAEFVGDVFWAIYADRWASVPNALRVELDARFKTPTQRAVFFS